MWDKGGKWGHPLDDINMVYLDKDIWGPKSYRPLNADISRPDHLWTCIVKGRILYSHLGTHMGSHMTKSWPSDTKQPFAKRRALDLPLSSLPLQVLPAWWWCKPRRIHWSQRNRQPRHFPGSGVSKPSNCWCWIVQSVPPQWGKRGQSGSHQCLGCMWMHVDACGCMRMHVDHVDHVDYAEMTYHELRLYTFDKTS